jgi:ectoine hydroxylase-related dioxygenase (phytanoyl-CoA dioxygenase family)
MKVSVEEVAAGKLLPENLELAVQLIKVNGYVLLEEVLPLAQVEELYNRYSEILNTYMEKHQEKIFKHKDKLNDGTNHVRLFLPFEQPFCDEAIVAHPFVTDVVDRILGDDYLITYFASNTQMPGGENPQPVHSDAPGVFGDRCTANPPVTNLVINFPLVDVDENNGPMEIWPGGTHLHPDNWYGNNWFESKFFRKSDLAEHMHSVKLRMSKRSILIRDHRMWHRGFPNQSNQARPIIAVIYTAATHAGALTGRIQIPQETYDQLSEKAKRLLHKEKIGFPVSEPSH